MDSERVDKMLNEYRECIGRCGHLETAIEDLEIQIIAMKEESVEEMTLKAQSYDFMPRRTGIGDPTGRVGTALAINDYPSYIKDMEREVSDMRAEIMQKKLVITFVDAWLNGLPERERWILRKQTIDKASWREVCYLYKREYGDEYSKEGLRRIRNAAMKKVYQIAQ